MRLRVRVVRVARRQNDAPPTSSCRRSRRSPTCPYHCLLYTSAARLVRLALEGAPAGSSAHAVAEQGIATRAIAEAIGNGLGVPVISIPESEAGDHFGWMGRFFGADATSSNTITRELLHWTPTHQGLLEDLADGFYFAETRD